MAQAIGVRAPNPEKLRRTVEIERGRNAYIKVAGVGAQVSESDGVSQNIFLTWQDLTQQDIAAMNRCPTIEQKREFLDQTLRLDERYPADGDEMEVAGNDRRRSVFLDLSMQTLNFCKQAKLSAMKASTLFSIVKTMHTSACELPGPPPTLEACYSLFEDLLLKHAVERPPFSVAIFTHHEVKAISEHILSTYFRHLKMYQYVFGTTNELDLRPKRSLAAMVDPSKIQPLSQAVSAVDLNEQEAAAAAAAAVEAEAVAAAEEQRRAAAEAAAREEASKAKPVSLAPIEVPQVFDNEEDQAAFAERLISQMGAMQSDLSQRMAEQQQSFLNRLGALEGSLGLDGGAGGKDHGERPVSGSRPKSGTKSRGKDTDLKSAGKKK